MTTGLVLIGLAVLLMIILSTSGSVTDAARASSGARPSGAARKSPQARLKAAARAECEALNETGREKARASGDWDDRPWLHPDDWVRMRSPILLLVATARADGHVHQEEADVVASWVAWRLKNSHWGGSYTDSKIQALRALTVALAPSTSEIEDALDDCAKAMSNKQRSAFLERLDQLGSVSVEAGAQLAARIRSRLENTTATLATSS